jgi:hypothetical protein
MIRKQSDIFWLLSQAFHLRNTDREHRPKIYVLAPHEKIFIPIKVRILYNKYLINGYFINKYFINKYFININIYIINGYFINIIMKLYDYSNFLM